MKEINARIRQYRRLRNLAQTEVAERIGKKCSTYSQMKRKGEISCEVLIKLSEIFRVDTTTLLYGEGDYPTYKEKPKPEPKPLGIFPALSKKEIIFMELLRHLNSKYRTHVMEYTYKIFKKI